jgi:hypothetical protein
MKKKKVKQSKSEDSRRFKSDLPPSRDLEVSNRVELPIDNVAYILRFIHANTKNLLYRLWVVQ